MRFVGPTRKAWQKLTVAAGTSANAGGVYNVAPADSSGNITVTVASGFNGSGDPRLGGWITYPLILDGLHLDQTGSRAQPATINFQIERVTDPTVANSNIALFCGICAGNTLSGSVNYVSAGFNWTGAAGANPSSYLQYRVGGANVPFTGASTAATRGGATLAVANSGYLVRGDGMYVLTGGTFNSTVNMVLLASFSVTNVPFHAFIGITSSAAVPANTAVTFRARYRGVAFPEAL